MPDLDDFIDPSFLTGDPGLLRDELLRKRFLIIRLADLKITSVEPIGSVRFVYRRYYVLPVRITVANIGNAPVDTDTQVLITAYAQRTSEKEPLFITDSIDLIEYPIEFSGLPVNDLGSRSPVSVGGFLRFSEDMANQSIPVRFVIDAPLENDDWSDPKRGRVTEWDESNNTSDVYIFNVVPSE